MGGSLPEMGEWDLRLRRAPGDLVEHEHEHGSLEGRADEGGVGRRGARRRARRRYRAARARGDHPAELVLG